jgi:hypothetical protein
MWNPDKSSDVKTRKKLIMWKKEDQQESIEEWEEY